MSKIFILLLFVGFVFAVVRWQQGQYQDFMSCAAKVSGVITKKEERRFRPSDPSSRMEYTLHYSYVVGGKEYNASDNVEFMDLWMDFKEGAPIEVYYSKLKPSESHPVPVMNHRLGGAPTNFGGGCS